MNAALDEIAGKLAGEVAAVERRDIVRPRRVEVAERGGPFVRGGCQGKADLLPRKVVDLRAWMRGSIAILRSAD